MTRTFNEEKNVYVIRVGKMYLDSSNTFREVILREDIDKAKSFYDDDYENKDDLVKDLLEYINKLKEKGYEDIAIVEKKFVNEEFIYDMHLITNTSGEIEMVKKQD
jgi:hypothetical protein